MHSNLAHLNSRRSGINRRVQNSLIENNLVYDNHASGISLYKIDGAPALPEMWSSTIRSTTKRRPLGAQYSKRQHRQHTLNNISSAITVSGAIDISADSLSFRDPPFRKRDNWIGRNREAVAEISIDANK